MYLIVGLSNQGKTIRLCATIIMYTPYDLRVVLYKQQKKNHHKKKLKENRPPLYLISENKEINSCFEL